MLRKLLLKGLKLFNMFGYKITKIDKSAFPDQFKFFEKRKNEEIVVFDIGSNVGDTISRYKNQFSKAKVYSFEAISDLAKQQEVLFENDNKVMVINEAISNEKGITKFNVNYFQDTSSMLDINNDVMPDRYGDAYQPQKQVEVKTTTLDLFCAEYNVDQIDIIKMDIQGAELMALKGAKDLLNEGKIKMIYLECSFLPMYKGQDLFSDIIIYLGSFGYSLHYIYNISTNFKTGKPLQCDAIFIDKSMKGIVDYPKL